MLPLNAISELIRNLLKLSDVEAANQAVQLLLLIERLLFRLERRAEVELLNSAVLKRFGGDSSKVFVQLRVRQIRTALINKQFEKAMAA